MKHEKYTEIKDLGFLKVASHSMESLLDMKKTYILFGHVSVDMFPNCV